MCLARVIAVKIAVTALCWAGPLLLGPGALFEALGVPQPQPVIFGRLLGAAYAALCVAYGFGLAEARRGGQGRAAVWLGIVSNGLAAVLLAGYGLAGAWRAWALPGQVYMWASLAATALLTVLLAWCSMGRGRGCRD